ncbi:hypothetical protein D9758_003921 [Tetrapyrgos nigripes]|uniref:Uncharacterized protein n=1 Tax=Tetrapyrgos nigripes TaxID=182062 RepID=A0A8H5GLM9_9AGAR|nr:hypothetical protein D9758_003921 [Tetrapyrgos nigripes]
MMKRINKVEGLSGFLKGFVPALLQGYLALFLAHLASPVFVIPDGDGDDATSRTYLILRFRHFLVTVAGIPLSIIIKRAIYTPCILSFGSYKPALSVLLSPSERLQPWRLYLSPRIFAVALIEAVMDLALEFYFHPLFYDWIIRSHPSAYAIRIALYKFIDIPLEVISIRLLLRRHGVDDNGTTGGNPSEVAGLRKYPAHAYVIGSRQGPYTSLYDCVVKMVREEGWMVFYRGLIFSCLRPGLLRSYHYCSLSWTSFLSPPARSSLSTWTHPLVLQGAWETTMSHQEKAMVRPWKDVDQAYVRLEDMKSVKELDLYLPRTKSTSPKSAGLAGEVVGLESCEEGIHGGARQPQPTILISRLFYWGFVCPPFWLSGVIFWVIRRSRPVYGASTNATVAATQLQNVERKYAIRCLYAFLIFSVTVVGIAVTVWAVLVLKRFERDVKGVQS